MAGTTLFYKHSTRCSLCTHKLPVVEAFEKNHSGVQVVQINVIEERDVSDHLAELSGVAHASPQVILFSDGELAFHTSHHEITLEALEAAL